MFKNALVSVSDKTGLVEFLRPLVAKGLRVVSTGGTAEHLKKAGLPIVELKDQTGFPEVMGGRVKTLHPRVHMPILARDFSKEDFELLKKEGLEPFDLVIVNLYPFEQAFRDSQVQSLSEQELVEKIDIGGPTLLRAAAKNFSRITVLVNPSDYQELSEAVEVTLATRKRLAGKVFTHVAKYDALISEWFGSEDVSKKVFSGEQVSELRYGENPSQSANWYASSGNIDGLHSAKILQGKALSYNNLLDIEAAASLVQTFELPTAVAVKHNNPCGVASCESLLNSLQKAISADPVSVFGGIIALNQRLDASEAELLTTLFLECVVAPEVTAAAMNIFAKKKNLRVLEWPNLIKFRRQQEIRSLAGGFLVQSCQNLSSDFKKWNFLGEKPSAEILQDLIFAEKVCASLKSNSIAIVQNQQTLGLGMGQVNRVEATEHALTRVRAHHPTRSNLVLASDAFFPFSDSIEIAAKGGVKWVLQPGGSLKDNEVFEVAKKMGLQMVITGERHFRH